MEPKTLFRQPTPRNEAFCGYWESPAPLFMRVLPAVRLVLRLSQKRFSRAGFRWMYS
jgi:hypothetical protein